MVLLLYSKCYLYVDYICTYLHIYIYVIYCIKCVCHAAKSTGMSILLAFHKVISTKDGHLCTDMRQLVVLVNEWLVWPW